MKSKLIFISFFLVLSCSPQLVTINLKDPYTAKGFAYIYNNSDYENKTIRAKLDNNEDLKKFVKNLEKTCIQTVESGSMTKDLAILVGPSTKYLTTNEFLDVIDGNLKIRLNQSL